MDDIEGQGDRTKAVVHKDSDEDLYEVDKYGLVRKSSHSRRCLDIEEATIGGSTIATRESAKSVDDIITMEFEDCFRSKVIANNNDSLEESNETASKRLSMADWANDADTVDLRSYKSEYSKKTQTTNPENLPKRSLKRTLCRVLLATVTLVSLGLIAHLSVRIYRTNHPYKVTNRRPHDAIQVGVSSPPKHGGLVENISPEDLEDVVESDQDEYWEELGNNNNNATEKVAVQTMKLQKMEDVPKTEFDV